MAGGIEIEPNPTDSSVHYVKELNPLVQDVPFVHGLVGYPKKRSNAVQVDIA